MRFLTAMLRILWSGAVVLFIILMRTGISRAAQRRTMALSGRLMRIGRLRLKLRVATSSRALLLSVPMIWLLCRRALRQAVGRRRYRPSRMEIILKVRTTLRTVLFWVIAAASVMVIFLGFLTRMLIATGLGIRTQTLRLAGLRVL